MRTVDPELWGLKLKNVQKKFLMSQVKFRRNISMSKTMLLRKSFIDTSKEYIENSSLVGLKRFIDPNISFKLKIVWFLIVVAAFSSMITFNLTFLTEFYQHPLKVSLESSNVPVENYDFPSVSICNVNVLSDKSAHALSKYMLSILNYSYSIPLVEQVKKMGSMIDFEYDETMLQFADYLDKVKQIMKNNHEYDYNIFMLRTKCEDMFLRCMWQGSVVDCRELFHLRRTHRGFCCIFNYHKMYNIQGYPKGHSKDYLRINSFGEHSGLSVVLDPQVEDYSYPLNSMEGFEIAIFKSYNNPDISTGGYQTTFVGPNHIRYIGIEPSIIYSTDEVKGVPLNIRGCSFNDYMYEVYNGCYSLSECLENCKVDIITSLCSCVPYVFTSGRNIPLCSLSDISCLNKYKQKLMYINPTVYASEILIDIPGLSQEEHDSLYCESCYPNCDEINYKLYLAEFPYNTNSLVESLTEGLDMTNKSTIHINYKAPEGRFFRRDVKYDWKEIFSVLGGVCSLYIGFSLLSWVELVYHYVVRFYHYYQVNKRRYGNYITNIN